MARSRQHNLSSDRFSKPPSGLYATSFIVKRVKWLSDKPGANYIKVEEVQHPVFNKDVFALSAWDGNNNKLGLIIGDLPCPDECIPPPIAPFNRKFEISHIQNLANDSDNVLVLVQLSTADATGPSPQNSCSIYGVKVKQSNGELEARISPNDVFYISLE